MIRDFLEQSYYRIKVPIFEWKEQQWVRNHFYSDPVFKALDQELLTGPNPFSLAHVFPYGETPLRALFQMAEQVQLKPTDRFIDLGCGRGRAVFFLSRFFGCQATGVDLTPSFINKAQRLAKTYKQERVAFHCQDFLTYDFSQTTCVYLYGTTYSEEILRALEDRFQQLPIGSHIITASEPLPQVMALSNLASAYLEQCQISVKFSWGQGMLFLHEKIGHTKPMFALGKFHRLNK